MHVPTIVLLALAAAPYWETRPPGEWSEQELRKLIEDSPWAQIATASGGGAPGVQVYVATARVMRAAEAEFARRRKIAPDMLREEYEAFLREDGGKSLVLAIFAPDPAAFADGEESRRMQEESALKSGRQRVKMTGHFPPTNADPYLRLVFPRPKEGNQKALEFEFYVPGLPAPYRMVEFRLKNLVYRGKPDY